MIRLPVAQRSCGISSGQVTKAARLISSPTPKQASRHFSRGSNLQDAKHDAFQTSKDTGKPANEAPIKDLGTIHPWMTVAKDARERGLLCNVALLAKWKDEVANQPAPTARDSLAIKTLLAKVLSHGLPATQRFAALYVTKSALAIPPNGIKTPLAKRAIPIVQQLSEERDPEAMVLAGQLLEQSSIGPEMSGNLLKAMELYEAAVKMVDEVRWSNVPNIQIIVTPGDALFAFGAINVGSSTETVRNAAMQALERAVQQYNHFEACRFLEAHLDKYSAQRYDCLLRLAVTGHWPAAKALGDIACEQYTEYDKYDLAVRQDLLGSKKWMTIAEKLYLLQSGGIDKIGMTDSELYWMLCDESRGINLRASVPHPAIHKSSKIKLREDEKAAIKWYKSSAKTRKSDDDEDAKVWVRDSANFTWLVTAEIVMAYKHIKRSVHEDAHRMRHFKAIDWYLLAAIGGHVPAMVAGLQLAIACLLPWYVILFNWHIEQLPLHVRVRYDSELNKLAQNEAWLGELMQIIKDIPEKAKKVHVNLPDADLDRVLIFGHV